MEIGGLLIGLGLAFMGLCIDNGLSKMADVILTYLRHKN